MYISRDLEPGDQIAVKGYFGNKNGRLAYLHHGIFVSHKEGIIDFGGYIPENATTDDFMVKPGKIAQQDIGDFKGAGDLFRIEYDYDRLPKGGRKKNPDDVINTAKYLKEHPEKWGDYNLLGKNCECFAAYCKIGLVESAQVQEAKWKTLLASLSTGAIVGSSVAVAKSISSLSVSKQNQ